MIDNIFNLQGKTALIVGASSGIGEHFAKTLSQAGAHTILAARRTERLQNLQAELEKSGAKCHSHMVDVTNENSIQQLINHIEENKIKIDVLVNTAGMNIRNSNLNYTAEEWRTVMNVNLNGTWLVSQAIANHMIKYKVAGSIIHISSALDYRTMPISSTVYTASKAAVRQITKSLALELVDHNIRVNCIAPGFFETDINRDLLRGPKGERILQAVPMKRSGQLTELDGVLLLLASDASSYMTGSTLRIDGGMATDHIPV